MDGTTQDQYLGALGFNNGAQGGAQTQSGQGTSFAQSDAARRTSDVQRQLALSKEELAQAGTQERQGINNDYEDRGIFKSGLRGQSLAQQQGTEANKAAQLEAGAASDIGNIQSDMQRQLAAEQAAQAQTAANSQLSNLQLSYQQQQNQSAQSIAAAQLQFQQEQLAAQRDLWQRQLEQARNAASSNGG